MIIFTPEDIADLANTSSSGCAGNPHSPVRTASLPVPKGKDDLVPEGVGHTLRPVTAMPILPSLRRVTSFSRENYSSYEKMKDSEGQKEETKPSEKPAAVDGGDKQDSAQPDVSMAGQTDGANEENGVLMLTPSDLSTVQDPAEISRRLAERAKPGMDIEDLFDGPFECSRERTIRTSDSIISLSSWYGEMEERYITPFYEANTVSPASIQNENRKPRQALAVAAFEKMRTKSYDGSPPELLDLNNENRVPNYESSTLPRMGVTSDIVFGEMNNYDSCDIHARERSS
jgi:metal transporter CNNM